MEYGIVLVLLLLVFTGYVIVQETRAQMHWRSLVEAGDLDAIRQLVEGEIEDWHSQRVPKGTPPSIWHGVQTVQLLDVTPTAARVSCNSEGEYALVGGRRVETTSPLAQGMNVTKKLAEMLFYDIPNVKLDHAQIDVYTSFRSEGGQAEPRCILSTLVERRAVQHIDWDETDAADFVELTEGRFADSDNGLHAIEPLDWPSDAAADTTRSN